MERNNLPITADLFYANRHGEQFSERALQAWGVKGAFVHAASITLPKPKEVGDLEAVALAMAEAMFQLTNLPHTCTSCNGSGLGLTHDCAVCGGHGQVSWHELDIVKLRSPDAEPHETKRSMCVGDVVQFIFPHADACITVGCEGAGWTIIGRI